MTVSNMPQNADHQTLANELKQLIEAAKQRVAVKVNAELSLLYWHVGSRINQELLGGVRAEYGKQVIVELAKQLTATFGRGWSKSNLAQMVKFSQYFVDLQIVQTLSGQLSWSHFVLLLAIEKPVKREFYISLAQQERWSTRTMAQRIEAQLFERTLISKKPEDMVFLELKKLREDGLYNQDLLLKDPYLLDFLELNDHYFEKDLEDAILREIEQFLLELGAGFTFVERQKRITVDDDDFYMDLLFYNRNLRRLVLVELKLGHFKPEYKGQMEFYLRWLDKHERREGEAAPLGIILCSEKKSERVELMELDKSSIHVAEYLTGLPTKDEFSDKLQQITQSAAARLQNLKSRE